MSGQRSSPALPSGGTSVVQQRDLGLGLAIQTLTPAAAKQQAWRGLSASGGGAADSPTGKKARSPYLVKAQPPKPWEPTGPPAAAVIPPPAMSPHGGTAGPTHRPTTAPAAGARAPDVARPQSPRAVARWDAHTGHGHGDGGADGSTEAGRCSVAMHARGLNLVHCRPCCPPLDTSCMHRSISLPKPGVAPASWPSLDALKSDIRAVQQVVDAVAAPAGPGQPAPR